MALTFISCVFRVFIKEAMAFIGEGGAVIFINKGSLAIERRLFKTAKAGVNGYNLK